MFRRQEFLEPPTFDDAACIWPLPCRALSESSPGATIPCDRLISRCTVDLDQNEALESKASKEDLPYDSYIFIRLEVEQCVGMKRVPLQLPLVCHAR